MRLLGKGCTNSGLKRRDNERVEFIAIREMLTNYFLQRTAGPYRWVIFDRSGQSCLPVHVRFGLKADLRLVRQAKGALMGPRPSNRWSISVKPEG